MHNFFWQDILPAQWKSRLESLLSQAQADTGSAMMEEGLESKKFQQIIFF